MSQFYISNDSEADVQRCNESRDTRLPITITGLTRDGFVKEFRGVVQSVEHYPKRDAGTRFRVTISDSQATGRSSDDSWQHAWPRRRSIS
jgi:hypothetical protein